MTHAQPTEASFRCSTCNLQPLCLPGGLGEQELEQLDDLVQARRTVDRGASLVSRGDPFDTVYAVRSGFFKLQIASTPGRTQVLGFRMAGDLLGLNAIDAGAHPYDAIALEDSLVCVIRFHELEGLAQKLPSLQRQLVRLMSREVASSQAAMQLLGTTRAEERVAGFLLDLSQQLRARGFSSSALLLRMTRGEIGTYLGLRLETVSRCLSHLHDAGVLDVRERNIRVLDPTALAQHATGQTVSPAGA